MMKVEYKRELEAGDPGPGRAALPRDRAILRLHVVEGVSIEKIAASYGVHRVTVARWVWTAGETLLDGLRGRFREKFGIVPPRVRQHGADGAESAFDRSGGVARGVIAAVVSHQRPKQA